MELPQSRALNEWGDGENWRQFLANKLPYLRNGMRYGQGCYWPLIRRQDYICVTSILSKHVVGSSLHQANACCSGERVLSAEERNVPRGCRLCRSLSVTDEWCQEATVAACRHHGFVCRRQSWGQCSIDRVMVFSCWSVVSWQGAKGTTDPTNYLPTRTHLNFRVFFLLSSLPGGLLAQRWGLTWLAQCATRIFKIS